MTTNPRTTEYIATLPAWQQTYARTTVRALVHESDPHGLINQK